MDPNLDSAHAEALEEDAAHDAATAAAQPLTAETLARYADCPKPRLPRALRYSSRLVVPR